MDQRMKDIMARFDSMKIGLDEPFQFGCTMCGECCINREDILLSPRDIYRMAKELGLSAGSLFLKYCEAYVGQDSRMPVVRLNPSGPDRRCPLLKDRKCMVHNAKPTVCAMFPIGRCLVGKNPGEGITDISKTNLQYIFVNPGCGNKSSTYTVREYLESSGIPVYDEYFMEWQRTVLRSVNILRKAEKEVRKEVMEQVWSAAFASLYLHYDTMADFMPQFAENVEKFSGMMNQILHNGGFNPKP